MDIFHQDPTQDSFVQDPYPFYDRARASGPLFRWAEYDGLVCTPDHALGGAILKDRRFGREIPAEARKAPPAHMADFHAVEAHSMLELEPPTHTRLRGLVLRAFTTRRIAALAPEIATLSHQLIDRIDGGTCDLLPAFANRLPVIVICRLLGVPEDMEDQLLAWSHDMVSVYMAGRTRADEERASQAARAFSNYIRAHVETRRARPGDDLITQLIAAEEDGSKLNTDELITTCILLLNAGHEATVHTIGNGVKALLDWDGDARAALAPDAIDATVEEIIRFDPPLHMFTRYAYEDIDIAGHTFRRGDQVGVLLAACNRDAAAYDAPAEFRPDRRGPVNLSFGAGVHFCVGAPLARLELVTALPILFDRLPGLHLNAPPRYSNGYHFHGLERLEIAYDAG